MEGEKGHDTPSFSGPVQNEAEVTFRTEDLSPRRRGAASDESSDAEAQAQVVDTMKAPPYAEKSPGLSRSRRAPAMRTRHAGILPRLTRPYATARQREFELVFALIEVRMIPRECDECGQIDHTGLMHLRARSSFTRTTGRASRTCWSANARAPKTATAISSALRRQARAICRSREGQKIILLSGGAGRSGQARRSRRVSVYADDQLKATIAINDVRCSTCDVLPFGLVMHCPRQRPQTRPTPTPAA